MKTLYLSIIIIVGISITSIISLLVIVPYLQLQSIEGPSCLTLMTIIYDDPVKYDPTTILSALRNNLSKDDFTDVYGTNVWWKYVHVGMLNKNGTVKLEIPSGNGKTVNMTEKIISKIDGVSKIYSLSTVCYDEIMEKYNPPFKSMA